MPRLGIVGTLVWDTIYPHAAAQAPPHQDWGGIAYSLAAFEATRPPGWSMLPILKVGADLGDEADTLLSTFGSVDSVEGVLKVPEPNNRVELFYEDRARRCERLSGGVPGWTWPEVEPLVLSCDALYVNYIAGWELDLDCSVRLGRDFSGGKYCDVHSLLLAVGNDGVRHLQPLPQREAWLGGFDIVQVNEQELETLTPGVAGTVAMSDDLLGCGPEAVFVTRGEEGAEWAARADSPWLLEREGPPRTETTETGRVATAETRHGTVGAVRSRAATVDPTGCGDVWGMAAFAALLGGASLPRAAMRANRVASRCAGLRGASGLAEGLAVEGSARQ